MPVSQESKLLLGVIKPMSWRPAIVDSTIWPSLDSSVLLEGYAEVGGERY